ncbi:MAG: minichromosome maintenance protein MCM [Candidatus Altiarchaeota archaeon]|nr:minichromosome maintenance protein MCM [Candidatus Altiarchaeota archaeon]
MDSIDTGASQAANELIESLPGRVEDFLRDVMMEKLLKTVSRGEKALLIDFTELDKYDPDLSDRLLDQPEETLHIFEDVIDLLRLSEKPLKSRIHTLPESLTVRVRDLRSSNLNKLIHVEGIIRQASEVRPEVVKTVWECPLCGNEITTFQTGVTLEKPSECVCGNRKGFLMKDKDFSDVQKITIEENPEALEGTEQPSRISILLRHDLVDPTFRKKIVPGNLIGVVGIMKEVPLEKSAGKRFDIMVEANSVEAKHQQFEELKITVEDRERIKEIAAGDPWSQIVNSIAPSIYGHQKIKEAITLQMFGGVRKMHTDGTVGRGDVHVLLVGDPGAGKSQLLKYTSKVSPKSRYVAGKGASAVGLTATVVKDDFLKGWTLEAGALVLASGGIVCIDEMDKIARDDIYALHEAMEQQSITVAKANIFATLRAETSILAAANPKYGRFDLNAPIAEQISMPETILSRFDCIFAVKDVPNPDKDARMADHILALQSTPDEAKPVLDAEILRKYVAHAKNNIKPKLNSDALYLIKTFFVDLRKQYMNESSVPISPRQLEALVRLTEASAKLRLSPIGDKNDAKRAIDIIKYTLYQLAFDIETGKLDIDKLEGGIAASKRNKMMTMMNIIRDLENQFGKTVPKAKVIESAETQNISIGEVERMIDELRTRGHIIEPKQGYIERI